MTKYYMIVEFDSNGKGPNRYRIIDAKAVLNVPHVNHDTIYTGKKLLIRDGSRQKSVTCVIISKQRSFICDQLKRFKIASHAEWIKIRKLKEEGSVSSTKNYDFDSNWDDIMVSGDSKSSECDHNDESDDDLMFSPQNTSSASNSDNPQQQEQSPSDDGGNNVELMKREVGVSTTPLVKSVPPMTFDQQTQTDLKLYENLIPASAAQVSQQSDKITHLLEVQSLMVEESNRQRHENAGTKNITAELSVKVNQIMDVLSAINTKLEGFSNNKSAPIELNGLLSQKSESKSEPFLLYSTSTPQALRPISSVHNSRNNVSVETYEITDNCELTNMSNTSDGSEYYPTDKTNTGTSKKGGKNSQILENIRSDWPDFAEIDGDFVPIGSNKTLIPKHVMRGINWKSHSSATRKLLMTVFDRDILATHSLTGKPSPAFLTKSAKMQLDPTKIQDIVETVTKYCSVTESTVRSVITSKCADENKMKRHSLNMETKKREKKVPMNLQNDSEGNKENMKGN